MGPEADVARQIMRHVSLMPPMFHKVQELRRSAAGTLEDGDLNNSAFLYHVVVNKHKTPHETPASAPARCTMLSLHVQGDSGRESLGTGGASER